MEKVHVSLANEKVEETENVNKVRAILEERIDKLQIIHQKWVAELKDEVNDEHFLINELRDISQKYTVAHQHLLHEYEKLKQEEDDKIETLQQLIISNKSRGQARRKLEWFEYTVAKEFQKQHNLKKLFIQDLQSRIGKSVIIEHNEDHSRSLAQNLKQLAEDNAYLRCLVPQLEKKLNAFKEDIRVLETELKERKKCATRDGKNFQFDIHRINEAARRHATVPIEKPIPPVQQ